MSLEDWRHGLHTGLEQDFIPALRRRDEDWRRVCKKIIDYCVAPEMRTMAMNMLDGAMTAAHRDVADEVEALSQPAPANTPNRPHAQSVN